MHFFKQIIKWFKEDVLNIKPIFKIEIKESWFSPDYVYIRYSPNNGYKWYVITGGERDYETNCRWKKYKVATAYYKIDCIETVINANNLNSYENCKAYVEKVYDWVEEHNAKAYEEYMNKIQPGRDFIKNFNKQSK